ncbi:MAG: hypothetical protein ABXS91_11160 [Sulfurimonas sp.]
MINLSNVFTADKQVLINSEELIEYYAKAFMVDTKLRQAHFFAQMREEVGVNFGLSRAESLNYKCKALTKLFSYFRKNRSEAKKLGRCNGHRADQEAIANRVYANRMGNGGIDSGDGWRTRGRGAFQLTGTVNYKRITRVIYERTGIVLDFYSEPGLLLTPIGAIMSAMAFWYDNGLWKIADNGAGNSTINAVTRKVNRYTHSYKDRVSHFRAIQAAW